MNGTVAMRENPPARIFLRPVGSPLSIAMAGLAIASLMQAGLDLSWIPVTETSQVGLVLIAVPFVLQLVACVFAYLARDGATGSAVGVLSTTWLAIGLVHLVSTPGVTSPALGTLTLAAGSVLVLSAIVVSSQKLLPASIFALAGARFAIDGIYQLSAVTGWQHLSGVVGLVVSGLAGYAVVAFAIEDQQGHPVLPTLRRGEAATAARDGMVDVERLGHEAGVRELA